MRMALLILAVVGVVLLVAGRIIGGVVGHEAMRAGGVLALGTFVLTVVGWLVT
jgi:hypothetical protein